MKKIRLFSGLAMLALLCQTGCTDDVVSSSISVDQLPKASITGYVTTEMNLQTAGLEMVPEGTKLFVEVNYSDLNSSATGKWKDTVSVAADGKYQVAVPATGNGVTVTITPFAFEADQTQGFGALYKTIKKAYNASPVQFMLRSGQALSKDITYTISNLPNFVDKVSISGKVQANLNAAIVGLENVPDGTVINFYTSSWKDSVTVQNGTYSIVVPTGVLINWSSKFVATKLVWVTNSTSIADSKYMSINYTYTITGSSYYNSNTTTADLTAGEGSDLTVDPMSNVTVLSGKIIADIDATIPGSEDLPASLDGTKITFYAGDNSWGGTATITGGKYTINIPRNKTIQYYATFVYNKKMNSVPTYSSTNYTTSGMISSTSSSTLTTNLIAY